MFSRIKKAIRPSGRSDFDSYIGNLSKSGNYGGPTADEARKDYRATVWSESVWAKF